MNKQKGLTLYISIIIMVILLSIVLGLGTILVNQLKIIKGIERSIVAFYAAETGIEATLLNRANPVESNETLDNGATYMVNVLTPGTSNCSPAIVNFCVNSVGEYMGVKRAIQISY